MQRVILTPRQKESLKNDGFNTTTGMKTLAEESRTPQGLDHGRTFIKAYAIYQNTFKIPQNLAYTQSAALTRGKVKSKIKDTNQISVDNSTGPYKIMHKNNLKIILLYSYN